MPIHAFHRSWCELEEVMVFAVVMGQTELVHGDDVSSCMPNNSNCRRQ